MTRLLVVDDSAIVRSILSTELSKYPDLEVITAPDPFVARDKIIKHRPDVITLDIEMPRMDGLTFLRQLMKYWPLPVIVVSSLTPAGGSIALEALDLGAYDVLCKPGSAYSVEDMTARLAELIRQAAKIDRFKLQKTTTMQSEPAPIRSALTKTTHQIIAIGASTGGTVAIETVLRRLPQNTPGIVVVQHMPEKFTRSFADRLNEICQIEVAEAVDGDTIVPGTALIAPGNYHLMVKRNGARYFVEISQGPPVFHQRPSVEIMFQSVAKYAGSNAIGILLTGMGCDGAQGLLSMRQAGAHTIAQDEQSSVVWGMPGAAVKIGAAESILPLEYISEKAMEFADDNEKRIV